MKHPVIEAESRSGHLEIDQIGKRFGTVDAINGVGLAVGAGEFVTILGPSGSGKTTLLKVIAGFEVPDRGHIRIDGVEITDLDPAARNIGMVFQNYALFPHMTVARNVAYPLTMRGVAKAEIEFRVLAALAMVELEAFTERLPKQLSGGQQQRVALARAIVFRPRLLLLDEPFGALDRKLREQMQLEVRRLQRQLGLTTIFITHDQEEALVMSDRIAVMNAGRLEQVGRPHEVYEVPANAFIANFIGESNVFSGVVERSSPDLRIKLAQGQPLDIAGIGGASLRPGQRVTIMIRPERFVDLSGGGSSPALNRLEGEVIESVYIGVSDKYRVRTTSGLELLVRLSAGENARRYRAGETIAVGFAAADARLIEVQ